MQGLFSPLKLRTVTFKNRIAVSPMSQYRAINGYANNWHLVHLGRFALGGAGLIFAEATAISKHGRRTHGDLGIWEDGQVEKLKTICAFIEAEGSVPGIQLSHAGRKASEKRPWEGETPVDEECIKTRNEHPWKSIAPSPIPYAEGWPIPAEMSNEDIERTIEEFGQAAKRSFKAGFKVIEVYAAHGFLVHQFLSPISNQRTDEWGGKAENRQRFAMEVAKSIRTHWPEDLPLIFRLSATDWLEDGIEIEDTIETVKKLKAVGVDMIDTSTGGIGGKERPSRMIIEQGFQVPFAKQIRDSTEVPTMAVGFLWDVEKCAEIINNEEADMIALAREILDDPHWPIHAAKKLQEDETHKLWPIETGWWLMKRDRLLGKLGLR